MLSAAKHLAAHRDRPFAEFTLSEAHVLRVTRYDCSNGQGLFFTIEPCLSLNMLLINIRFLIGISYETIPRAMRRRRTTPDESGPKTGLPAEQH